MSFTFPILAVTALTFFARCLVASPLSLDTRGLSMPVLSQKHENSVQLADHYLQQSTLGFSQTSNFSHSLRLRPIAQTTIMFL